MPSQYDLPLVSLSVIVAVAASYAALGLSERVANAGGHAARAWLAGGAVAMGVGIWSMHFIGMLAYSLPIEIAYDAGTTAASLALGILVSALALGVVGRPVVGRARLLGGAVLMGAGICLMHYTGMAAIEAAPGIDHDPLLVGVSVAVAVGASLAALWIMSSLLRRPAGNLLRTRMAAACVMGIAISGMHYTAMAAAHFPPDAVYPSGASDIDHFWLAIAVAMGALALLGVTVMGSVLAAHLDSTTAQINVSLRQANEELIHLATHDALTGLPNRTLLNDRIERAIMDAERNQRQFALLFIDLDRFKVVNDSVGHHIGDGLLREMAQRIGSRLRRSDTLARLGGDEFVVLLKDLDQPQAAADIASQILAALQPAFRLEAHVLHMSASLGVSVYPNDGTSVDTLLASADAAMYHAKQEGRNAFKFFAPAMNAFAHERLEMENGLRRGLIEGEFELHYQPKVDIDSGTVISLEALVRWNHPTRGRVRPDQFIPIAEESGLIGPLGEWVLRTACLQNKAWQDAGLEPMRVAVNLSAKQFRQMNLLAMVRQVLQDTGLQARYLELELTESTVMSNPEESVKVLESLSEMGVHIAIDDFGTGYSSLAYLKRLPLNVLKVDRSFVRDLASNPDDASIVQAVISMAHSLRLKVIAEGVETQAQLDLLRSLGCDHFQGFFFSTAVNAQDARRFMASLSRSPSGAISARPPTAETFAGTEAARLG